MPGKGAFSRCVESVASRGSASDPRAVCAAAGRKKYGAKKFAAMAKAGKKRAARAHRNAPLKLTRKMAWAAATDAGNRSMRAGGRKSWNEDDYNTATEEFNRLWTEPNPKRKHGKHAHSMTRNEKALIGAGKTLAMAKAAPLMAVVGNKAIKTRLGTYTIRQELGVWYVRTPDDESIPFDTLKQARAFLSKEIREAEKTLGPKKKNPSGRTAEEAYRDFHGREAGEILEFDAPSGSKASMLPRKTSAIGDLIELDIRVPKDRHVRGPQYVTLERFGKCWLTEHPRMKQLYIEGGDQSVDLEKFGLDDSEPHEWEYLGELVRCVYFTRKDHLGKDGGTAQYHHRFGKNELTLKKTELIKVAYHVPDEQLWFMGGGYEIPSEGIDG